MFRANVFPILMLHYVSDISHFDSHKPYSLKKDKFNLLLNILQEDSWKTETFQDEYIFPAKHSKNVRLTFDDGARHLLDYVVPKLMEYKMKATFFIPTKYIGKLNEWDIKKGLAEVELMNETEIEYLASIGMEIGSHAHSHTALGSQSLKDVEYELKISKDILDSITGVNTVSVAYPYGSVPDKVESILVKTGYKFGCSIFYNKIATWALRRIIIHDSDTPARIRSKLSRAYYYYRCILDNTNIIKNR